MKEHYQLAIIGSGPAGLAAAKVAADLGLDTILIDEQIMPGGQIYRTIETIPAGRAALLGEEYQRGKALVDDLRDSGVDYLANGQVWSVNSKCEIGVVHNDTAHMISAERIILATGAMERAIPFQDWTLPGVMNAGAGQILFKAHGVVPDDGVVMAGSGPLLLLLAWQYLHAGVKIGAILDLTPMQNHLRALPYLPRAMLARHYLSKGLTYKKDLKRAGVKTYRSVSELKAEGDLQLSSVSFKSKGNAVKLDTELLLVHFGVIPHTHLSRAAGCEHAWDRSQQCWRPVVDRWGRSSIDGILIAGDGGGIVGARTAEHTGQLATLQVAHDLGLISRQQRDASGDQARKWLREDQHVRPFLENYFRIPDKFLATTPDNTIICRCEEVTAGDIRQAVVDGYTDNNRIKSLTRCGMGPCQGRQCDHAVAHIIACAGGEKPGINQHYRGRPPVTPLRLGQLASLYPEEKE